MCWQTLAGRSRILAMVGSCNCWVMMTPVCSEAICTLLRSQWQDSGGDWQWSLSQNCWAFDEQSAGGGNFYDIKKITSFSRVWSLRLSEQSATSSLATISRLRWIALSLILSWSYHLAGDYQLWSPALSTSASLSSKGVDKERGGNHKTRNIWNDAHWWCHDIILSDSTFSALAAIGVITWCNVWKIH